MDNNISNTADISSDHCLILHNAFTQLDDPADSPSSYFNSLPRETALQFYEKLELQCLQVLKRGYKSWSYKKYRLNPNGQDGVLALNNDVIQYLLTSSENDNFVNLKELFKNKPNNINRNIRSTIKRVLAANRDKTVIDRLLRRIEEITDSPDTPFSRSRGEKEDFFTLENKFPEKREPTNEEIETVISKIGHFPEVPSRPNAKQASKVYSTDTLSDMFFIICESLKTDVTPNTLETIFLDLIPDYLPPDFVAEKTLLIYGHFNFSVDVESRLSLEDLDQENRLLVLEAVQELNQKIREMQILEQCLVIKVHLDERNLSIPTLSREEVFTSREHVEETLNILGELVNSIFSTFGEEEVAEIAYQEFFKSI